MAAEVVDGMSEDGSKDSPSFADASAKSTTEDSNIQAWFRYHWYPLPAKAGRIVGQVFPTQ